MEFNNVCFHRIHPFYSRHVNGVNALNQNKCVNVKNANFI